MIEVQNLTKYYGAIPAIREVSFEVGQGEIIGLLGPNGAGKSTTMRILTGFAPASSGTARVDGHEVHEEPLAVKRRVGYLPEQVPLYDEMVVSSFLRYIAEIKGVSRGSRGAEVARVVDACGLGEVRQRVVGNLSKGYRQRAGLAQALIGSPPVLVLDEPTVGLDPRQIVEIRQLIKGLSADHTILISTHILPEVTMLCERVVIIHGGRVVAQDSMANLTGTAGGQAFALEVEGAEAEVLAALDGVHGISRARCSGPGHYVAEAKGGSDPGAELARALVSKGLALRQLQPQRRSLEDVFMEAVGTEHFDGGEH